MDLFHLLHDIFKMIRRREKYDEYVDSHGGERKEGIGESYFDLSTPSAGEKEAKKPSDDEEKKKE